MSKTAPGAKELAQRALGQATREAKSRVRVAVVDTGPPIKSPSAPKKKAKARR